MRSCFSLLESCSRLEDIINRQIELGFGHMVLTDHYSMYGTMRFLELCRQKNVHGIIGLELEAYEGDNKYSFVCLAKNDKGLQDLYVLSTRLLSNNNRIDLSDMVSLTQSTVVISSRFQDTLEYHIEHQDKDAIKEILSRFNALWTDYFVAISMNDSMYWKEKNILLREAAKEIGVQTTAVSRTEYIYKEDVENLKTLRAIAQNAKRTDQTLDVRNDRYIRTQEEMAYLYEKEDLQTTDTIAQMCNIHMAFRKSKLPVFQNKYNAHSDDYLKSLCKAGLEKRMNGNVTREYVKRLEYELNTIINMGYTDYFLIVWDFIRWSRQQGIMVGPGRGSAAGSLVAWCLGITHLDPIKNGLLFERFLNPDRVSMPDIDTDFPDNRRDDVIEYVTEKYGKEHVSRIVTFNTLKAKQVLRDVGRTLNIATSKIDTLTKQIPNVLNITLSQAYQTSPGFRRLVDTDKILHNLYELSLPLEGLPRHLSIHAAGVVLSDQPVEKVCPLVEVEEGVFATQFTMNYLEELGLIKMDFLALRNLTTIDEIVRAIKEERHIDIDVLKLPLNDAKTYQLLSAGDTIGVFQLESSGIRQLIRKLKPSCFEDISAVLALYRPGPMQNTDLYIERKNDPSKVVYPHPKMEPILKETYGILIYQEQIMQTAVEIAGFTMAQADFLRKAMSKKDAVQLEKYRESFIQGALQNKVPYKTAVSIFESIERFAEYGFNKSHSYVYALICYQMAYLKANYPQYFYRSLLNSVIGSDVKTSEYIYECRHRGIKVLGCDVNQSEAFYHVEHNNIRMPLQVLKGVSINIYPAILKERDRHGPFKDYTDFVIRCCGNNISQSTIQILIDGGALDCFGYNRASMQENLPKTYRYASLSTTITRDGFIFEEGAASRPLITKMSENPIRKAQRERDVLGFYLEEHPVESIRKDFYPNSSSIEKIENFNGYVSLVARIAGYRTHKTRRGDTMCFLSLEDETGKMDAAVMPDLYKIHRDEIDKDAIVYITGKKDRPDSVLVRTLKPVKIEG